MEATYPYVIGTNAPTCREHFACLKLVLYGMKLSTNESQASTFLDQWEWTRLVLSGEGSGDTETSWSITGNYSALQLYSDMQGMDNAALYISLYPSPQSPPGNSYSSLTNLFILPFYFQLNIEFYRTLLHTIIYRTFFSWKFSRSLTPPCPGPDTSNFTSFLILQHCKLSNCPAWSGLSNWANIIWIINISIHHSRSYYFSDSNLIIPRSLLSCKRRENTKHPIQKRKLISLLPKTHPARRF